MNDIRYDTASNNGKILALIRLWPWGVRNARDGAVQLRAAGEVRCSLSPVGQVRRWRLLAGNGRTRLMLLSEFTGMARTLVDGDEAPRRDIYQHEWETVLLEMQALTVMYMRACSMASFPCRLNLRATGRSRSSVLGASLGTFG
jgi:hypothetical protein